MRDLDVRSALWSALKIEHKDQPDTLILDEFGVCNGVGRVDIAVVNGELCGFELKSDSDRLDRLPDQIANFSGVLDRMTLVVGGRHAAKARAMIPDWWGVQIARDGNGSVSLERERYARFNPKHDPEMVAALLWHDEALALLDLYGAARGLRSKPRGYSYMRIAELVPLDDLRHHVRSVIKLRDGWRSPAQSH